ncbi:MAG: hypothetical protein KGI27_11495 [Thaumarchaeota archaeon]|nr:hypothetical protein [Nitrososphaerota archaeon]
MHTAKHPTKITGGITSLADLKSMATRLLPATSALRMLILSEPDILPRSEVMAKLEIFLRLLYQELADGYTVRLTNIMN